MARFPRFNFPCISQHVVQRGNNRLPCFLYDYDGRHCLQCLLAALGCFRCESHTQAVMDNHVHLLITPRAYDRNM